MMSSTTRRTSASYENIATKKRKTTETAIARLMSIPSIMQQNGGKYKGYFMLLIISRIAGVRTSPSRSAVLRESFSSLPFPATG